MHLGVGKPWCHWPLRRSEVGQQLLDMLLVLLVPPTQRCAVGLPQYIQGTLGGFGVHASTLMAHSA